MAQCLVQEDELTDVRKMSKSERDVPRSVATVALDYHALGQPRGVLWCLTLAQDSGREEYDIHMAHGMYIEKKRFDKQGRLWDILREYSVQSVWFAVESCLEACDIQAYVRKFSKRKDVQEVEVASTAVTRATKSYFAGNSGNQASSRGDPTSQAYNHASCDIKDNSQAVKIPTCKLYNTQMGYEALQYRPSMKHVLDARPSLPSPETTATFGGHFLPVDVEPVATGTDLSAPTPPLSESPLSPPIPSTEEIAAAREELNTLFPANDPDAKRQADEQYRKGRDDFLATDGVRRGTPAAGFYIRAQMLLDTANRAYDHPRKS